MKNLFHKATYKIIDRNGKTIMKAIKNWNTANNLLPNLKIHKSEKLEVVEE